MKAVGLPSIQNKVPRQLHTVPETRLLPYRSMYLSQDAGLAYTASTSVSSSVVKSVIDFGDGTVIASASASHTYSDVGSYLITATVFDSAGASSVAVQRISAKPPSAGITITSPANNATVNWPTHVVASAPTGSAVAGMQVLIDGSVAYATHGDTINTILKVSTGVHQISVQSLGASGKETDTASLSVDGEPNDIPPIAKISVKPMPSISPTTVLACTAGSSAPDGFIGGLELLFSDGGKSSSPAAFETFSSPGTYGVTAKVSDNFGATDVTTITFSVGNDQ